METNKIRTIKLDMTDTAVFIAKTKKQIEDAGVDLKHLGEVETKTLMGQRCQEDAQERIEGGLDGLRKNIAAAEASFQPVRFSLPETWVEGVRPDPRLHLRLRRILRQLMFFTILAFLVLIIAGLISSSGAMFVSSWCDFVLFLAFAVTYSRMNQRGNELLMKLGLHSYSLFFKGQMSTWSRSLLEEAQGMFDSVRFVANKRAFSRPGLYDFAIIGENYDPEIEENQSFLVGHFFQRDGIQ